MTHHRIALALFAVVTLAAGQDQHIIPAAGDYRVMDLVLEKAGEKMRRSGCAVRRATARFPCPAQ